MTTNIASPISAERSSFSHPSRAHPLGNPDFGRMKQEDGAGVGEGGGMSRSPNSPGGSSGSGSSYSGSPPPQQEGVRLPVGQVGKQGKGGKPARVPSQPGVHKHACPHCPSTFSKSEHLSRHLRSHTKEKPFVCPRCGKRFSRQDSVSRHQRLHDEADAAIAANGTNGGGAQPAASSSTSAPADRGREAEDKSDLEPLKRKRRKLGSGTAPGGSGYEYSPVEMQYQHHQPPPQQQQQQQGSSIPSYHYQDPDPWSQHHQSLGFQESSTRSRQPEDDPPHHHVSFSTSGPEYHHPQSTSSSHQTISPNNPPPLPPSTTSPALNSLLSSGSYATSNPILPISQTHPGQMFDPLDPHHPFTPSVSGGGLHDDIGDMDMDLTGAFSSSTPDYDLLQLLSSDTTLAFAHTLNPAWHSWTRANSPTLGQSSNTNGGAGFMGVAGYEVNNGAGGMGPPQQNMGFSAGGMNGGQTPQGNHTHGVATPGNAGAAGNGPMDAETEMLWRTLIGAGFNMNGAVPGSTPASAGPSGSHAPLQAAQQLPDNPSSNAPNPLTVDPSAQPVPHEYTPIGKDPIYDFAPLGDGADEHAKFAAGSGALRGYPGFAEGEKEGVEKARPGPGATGSGGSGSGGAGAGVGVGAVGGGGVPRSQEALSEARCLISDLSFNLASEATPLSSEFLDLCLQMFFNRFLPTLHMIHRPTFSVRNASSPLLINMIAIGSLYLQTQDARLKGESLWRLVYKGVAGSWDRLIELRSGWDPTKGTPLVQTVLLGQLYACMSSRQAIRETPYIFHGLGIRIAKRSGILNQAPMTPREYLPPDGCTPADLDIAWRKWAARETQLRAVLGCYILEGQTMFLYQVPCSTPHLYNPLPLACEDALFNAPSAELWRQAVLRRSDVENASRSRIFLDIYKEIFAPTQDTVSLELNSKLSTFSRVTLLVGMQSIIADYRESQGNLLGAPSPQSVTVAMGRVYESLIMTTVSRMEMQGQKLAWHAVTLSLMLMQIPVKLRRYTGAMTDGPDYSEYLADLSWTRTRAGNTMLLHANAVRQLAESLPFASMSAPQFYLPPFLHLCAIVIIAWIKGNTPMNRSQRYDLDTEIDWLSLSEFGAPLAQSDLVTPVERFMTNGGTPMLRGQTLSLQDVTAFVMWLRTFGNVWGVALKMAEEVAHLITS